MSISTTSVNNSLPELEITTGGITCVGDRTQNIGTTTNAFDNLYVDGISFDDGANTLNDYDSSTWTPVLTTTGTVPTGVTYSRQSGEYLKVGNVVTVWFDIRLTNKGSGGTGSILFSGLPFTPASGNAWHGTISISNQTLGASQTYATIGADTNGNLVLIECGSGTTIGNPTWANASNNSLYIGSVSYKV